MDPITAILSAAAAAGAILGGDRKYIDPEWLKANFGAGAVTAEIQALFSQVIHSPAGQAILGSAAEAGQQFGRDTQRQAAQAGVSAAGGADSGTGIFATSAGESASNAAVAQQRGNIFQGVIDPAQRMVEGRMQAVLNDRAAGGQPTDAARKWGALGQAAGVALSANNAIKAPAARVDGLADQETNIPNLAPGADNALGGWGFLKKGGRLLGRGLSGFGRLVMPGR